mgnify:FL=1
MSVIVWDGKTLAADRRISSASGVSTTTKVFRRVDGSALVGWVGDAGAANELLAWLYAGADPEKFPPKQREDSAAKLIVITGPTGIRLYEGTPYPVLIEVDKFAEGSGAQYALAAMECGKTAVEAVEIASKLDPSCGNGITFETLGLS